MPALNFYSKDLYGSGYMDSRMQTVPEEQDQVALVDDQETAVKHQVRHDPAISRNILVGLGIITIVIVLFSIKGG